MWREKSLLLQVAVVLTANLLHSAVSDIASQPGVQEDLKPDCKANDDCIIKAKELIVSYMKALRKDLEFDKCRRYLEIRGCLQSRMKQCTHAHTDTHTDSHNDTHRHTAWNAHDWRPLIKQLDHICVEKLRASVEVQECVEDELRGLLSMRCDEFHKFNIQQRTRHECHFTRDRLHCKEALVTSACGTEAGNFAFHLLKVAAEKTIQKLSCTIVKDNQYPTFRYEQGKCERGFLESIEECTTRFLTERHVAKFHSENDLVMIGTAKEVKSACRAFKRYETCITPVKATCSEGVEMLFDYQAGLRRYVLKMEHICSQPVVEVYSSSVTCYQKVVNHSTLDSCNVHWSSVNPWLTNITAYQYYCQPQHTNTRNLMAEIGKVHSCYRVLFTSQCGVDAATVMLDLIDSALKDPLYLRLGYKPDCYLHGGSTPPTPTQRQTQATAQPDIRETFEEEDGVLDGPVQPTNSDLELESVTKESVLGHRKINFGVQQDDDLESKPLQTSGPDVELGTNNKQDVVSEVLDMQKVTQQASHTAVTAEPSVRHRHEKLSSTDHKQSIESYPPAPSSEMHRTEHYNGVRQMSLAVSTMTVSVVFQLCSSTFRSSR